MLEHYQQSLKAKDDELNQLRVTVRVLEEKNRQLQQSLEVEGQAIGNSTSSRRSKLLEEENRKLKQELQQQWEQMSQRELELKQLQLQNGSYREELKKLEKFDNERKQLNAQIDAVSQKLNQEQINFTRFKQEKETEIFQMEMKMKELTIASLAKQGNSEGDGIYGVREVLREVQELRSEFKIGQEFYDSLDALQKRVQDQEIEISRLKSERDAQFEEFKNEYTRNMEDEMDNQNLEKYLSYQQQIEAQEKKVILLEQKTEKLELSSFELERVELENKSLKNIIEQLKVDIQELETRIPLLEKNSQYFQELYNE